MERPFFIKEHAEPDSGGKIKNVGTSAAVLSELVKRLIEHLGQWRIEKVILSKQPDFIEKIRLSLMPIKWEISYCGIGKQGDRFSPRGINGSKNLPVLCVIFIFPQVSAGYGRLLPMKIIYTGLPSCRKQLRTSG